MKTRHVQQDSTGKLASRAEVLWTTSMSMSGSSGSDGMGSRLAPSRKANGCKGEGAAAAVA
jgi:hypothetical protein